MTDYQPLCDASETARENLLRLREAVRARSVAAELTKDLLTGPWILRCTFPGIRLPENVICGEVGGWWFFAWRRGERQAAVAEIDQVAASVARMPQEDDVLRP
jgi:hypothetical protein